VHVIERDAVDRPIKVTLVQNEAQQQGAAQRHKSQKQNDFPFGIVFTEHWSSLN
jgi:hypothetical protein